MPSEATTEHDGHAADRPRLPRRTRADRFDRRTAEFRRMRELAEMFTEALGGPAAISAMTALKIDTAAEMRTIAELARARHIAGEDVSLDDVVRCERQAERAERALGIEARQAKPSGPSLADYLEEKGKAA